jgi:stage V sporulation protein B
MGFGCMAIFLFFSKPIGLYIFHSPLAGFFIGELSFLCPLLYLNSTLSGIIQGLGKATALFTINLTTLLLRLCMTFFLVPHFGIQGYLWSLLAGQILQTILYLCVLFMKNLAIPTQANNTSNRSELLKKSSTAEKSPKIFTIL